jgi:lipopolysaccharide/colanic/teichoic acid biosynthesis glycosyltransferase
VPDSYRARGKRAFDVVASVLLLLVTSPVQVLVAVAVAVVNGRPVLFGQDRPGRNGEVFRLWKFRSMRAERFPGEPDAARLTSLGRFLRSTSLDELPELWNVLRGEMSLVGPRPLLVQYLPLYTPGQARRHEVRPGITGLAQVSGRNALCWEKKFELDVRYVDSLSFAGDLAILVKTVLHVVRRSGISAAGQATATPFQGRGATA